MVLRVPLTTDVEAMQVGARRYPGVTLRTPVFWGKAKMAFLLLHRTGDLALSAAADAEVTAALDPPDAPA